LTKEQADWLTWAKAEAAKMGPFGQGYPVPALDGSFESDGIPVGGPYPSSRIWPEIESRHPGQIKPPDASPQSAPSQNPWSNPGWKY